jgi:hypothetical protein
MKMGAEKSSLNDRISMMEKEYSVLKEDIKFFFFANYKREYEVR